MMKVRKSWKEHVSLAVRSVLKTNRELAFGLLYVATNLSDELTAIGSPVTGSTAAGTGVATAGA